MCSRPQLHPPLLHEALQQIIHRGRHIRFGMDLERPVLLDRPDAVLFDVARRQSPKTRRRLAASLCGA